MQCQNFFILLVFTFQASCSSPLNVDNSTEAETALGTFQTDISTLEETLAALTKLTGTQKQILQQQQTHRNQMKDAFSLFTQKEDERYNALETGQKMLFEIRGNLNRKIKALAKDLNGKNGNRQVSCNGFSAADIPPKDCASIYLDGEESSGVYKVWPTWNKDGKGFPVYCDMDTDRGGWTVIHRWENVDISEDYFERTWSEYKNGFGDLSTSFWIGTQKMYELTSQGSYELRFDFKDDLNDRTWSVYRNFRVDDETQNFAAHVEGFDPSGTGGDVFSSSNKKPFAYESQICGNTHPYRKVWWFNSRCDIDFKLALSKEDVYLRLMSSLIEMKVRPVQFSRIV